MNFEVRPSHGDHGDGDQPVTSQIAIAIPNPTWDGSFFDVVNGIYIYIFPIYSHEIPYQFTEDLVGFNGNVMYVTM